MSTRVRELKDLARRSIGPVAEQSREKLVPAVHEAAVIARERLAPHVDQARDRVSPVIADARTKVSPAVHDAATQAREKLGPVAEQAAERTRQLRQEVAPPVSAAVAAAAAAGASYRMEAKRRSAAAVAALRGEVEPPAKKHRLRTVLVALGLTGAAAAAYKWFTGRQAGDQWQQAYRPTAPAGADVPRNEAPEPEDPAAAAPDEVLADSVESPHPATTPDQPVEETAFVDPPVDVADPHRG